MRFLQDDKGNFSLMRVQSLICFLLFIYIVMFKTSELSFEIAALVGLLAFFPKMIQKFAESKL